MPSQARPPWILGFAAAFLFVQFSVSACTWSEGSGAAKRETLVAPPTLILAKPESKHRSMTGFFPNPNPVVQAVGSSHQREDKVATDRSAYLMNATELYLGTPGLRVVNPRMGRHYGTYELVELLQQVGTVFDRRYPGRAIRVGDLSRKRGGTIRDGSGRRVHSSHRNGLDADLMFLRDDCEGDGSFDHMSCKVDVERNLELMRMLLEGGPEPGEGAEAESLVDVFYVGHAFRDRVCHRLASSDEAQREYGNVVQRMELKGGHESHFHVRIRCPDKSLRCPAPRRYRAPLCPKLFARGKRTAASHG